jgi:putative addiction module component (TIGR02574 family)
MSTAAEDLIGKALILPIEERAEIIHRLLQSLDATGDFADVSWNSNWESELADRLAAYREGKIQAIDMDDAMEMIRRGERP